MTTPPNEDFEQAILANWAHHFRCPVDTLLTPGVTVLPAPRHAGDRVVVLNHLVAHTFVEFDPAYGPVLERIAAHVRHPETLTGHDLVRVLGADVFKGQDLSHLHYLYPPDLPPVTLPPQFSVRGLTPADAPAMTALHAACTPAEVDDGFVEVTHQAVFGCFDGSDGGPLVAAASGYLRAGFVDIGVLTHAGYRRQGLGRAVVAALSAWASAQGRIAQYRANTTNQGSLALARSLGFRLYFQAEVLWFAQ